MGLVRKLASVIGVVLVGICGILLGPTVLPDTVKFTEFSIAPPRDLGKQFPKNTLLNNVERLFENEIRGPEGFAIVNGELYTTLHGGYVAKVYEDQIVPVVKFGEPCEGWWEESKCGRPLGIKAVGNEYLVVADAYYGIFTYNVNTGKVYKVVDKDTVIDGRVPKVFNSLDVAQDGTIYWTHSSSDFTLDNCIHIFLADGSGRFVKYDPKTNTNTVLMKDLYMANGVVLSPNEDFVLVAESGHSRVHRYFLSGPKKFTSEIFIDGLPGVPDNLRQNGEGAFFVSLFHDRHENFPGFFQYFTSYPQVRKFFSNTLALIEKMFVKINEVYPNNFSKKAIHMVGHLEAFTWAIPSNTTLLEIDTRGNIIKNYHGTDGSFPFLSDVIPHNGYLYLGSPINEYLGRVELKKLGKAPVPRAKPPAARTPPQAAATPPPTPKPTTRPPPPPPTTRPPPPTTRAPPPTTTTTTARPTPAQKVPTRAPPAAQAHAQAQAPGHKSGGSPPRS